MDYAKYFDWPDGSDIGRAQLVKIINMLESDIDELLNEVLALRSQKSVLERKLREARGNGG